MSKPIFQFTKETAITPSNGSAASDARRSPLADLVSRHLRLKGARQASIKVCCQRYFHQL
jgi:hypothetical protein